MNILHNVSHLIVIEYYIGLDDDESALVGQAEMPGETCLVRAELQDGIREFLCHHNLRDAAYEADQCFGSREHSLGIKISCVVIHNC